jgi:large subunit ribosomal protein L29
MPREKPMIHDMSVGEVKQRIEEVKQELFNLRFRNSMRQLDNPLEIRYLRRDLARFKTALSEHRTGIHVLPGENAEAASPEPRSSGE